MSVKNYVLDTNVLLHDPQAIYKFEDNNVVVPIYVIGVNLSQLLLVQRLREPLDVTPALLTVVVLALKGPGYEKAISKAKGDAKSELVAERARALIASNSVSTASSIRSVSSRMMNAP